MLKFSEKKFQPHAIDPDGCPIYITPNGNKLRDPEWQPFNATPAETVFPGDRRWFIVPSQCSNPREQAISIFGPISDLGKRLALQNAVGFNIMVSPSTGAYLVTHFETDEATKLIAHWVKHPQWHHFRPRFIIEFGPRAYASILPLTTPPLSVLLHLEMEKALAKTIGGEPPDSFIYVPGFMNHEQNKHRVRLIRHYDDVKLSDTQALAQKLGVTL